MTIVEQLADFSHRTRFADLPPQVVHEAKRSSNSVAEPGFAFTDAELAAKFLHNAVGVIAKSAAERVVELVMGLDSVPDVRTLMRLTATSHAAPARAGKVA